MDDITHAALEVLLEDFKARWQELLNIEGEINTWTITYLTALFLTVAWVLGQKSKETLTELFKERQMLLLSVAVINASYMLILFSKDYRLQQDALYIYQVIAPRVSEISGELFNAWEEWRRQNTLTWGRFVYNAILAVPAISISMYILGRYAHDEGLWRALRPVTVRKIYFLLVLLFHVLVSIVAVSSLISVSLSWRKAIVEQASRNQLLKEQGLSSRSKVVLRDAVLSLQKLAAATEVGVNLETYNSLLTDAKMRSNQAMLVSSSSQISQDITAAVTGFMDAKNAWELSLKENDHVSTTDSKFDAWNKNYNLQVDPNIDARIHRDLVLAAMWKKARSHIDNASSRMNWQ
jgi:hypothetical protein